MRVCPAYRAICHDSTEGRMIVTLLVCARVCGEGPQGSQHADIEGGGGANKGATEAPRSQDLVG
jgi:hypothetical protein